MVMGRKRLSLIAVMVLALTASMLATAFISLAAANEHGTSQSDVLSGNSGFHAEGIDLYDNFTRTSSVGADPKQMVVGHLNSDSLPDVAVIYENNNKIEIFYQGTDGSFDNSPSKIIPASGDLTSIAIGDLDNDGLDDLVVCFHSFAIGYVQIYTQNLSFEQWVDPIPTYRNPDSLEVGDFDADGLNDLLVVSSSSTKSYFSIHRNSFNFVFDYFTVPWTSKATLSCIGNYDAFAGLDVAIGDPTTGVVSIWCNNNTNPIDYDPGNWTESTHLNLSEPTSVSFDQVTDTGNLALVVADRGTSKVSMWQWSSASQSFDEIKNIKGQGGIVDSVGIDLDHDSRMDIATMSNIGDNITYFYTPTGAFKGPDGYFPCHDRPVQLIALDMNGDGDEDLIVLGGADSGRGALTIVYAVEQRLSNANENIQGMDGMDALFMGNFTQNAITLGYLNQSADALRYYQMGKWWTIPVQGGSQSVYTGSLYDDRYQDVIVLNPIVDSVTIYAHSTDFLTRTSPYLSLGTDLPNPRSIYIADMDRSGTSDIIVGAEGGYLVYLNSGSGSGFSNSNNWTMTLPGSKATWIMAGDFNVGDETVLHLTDIAIINSTSDRLEIYFQHEGPTKFEVVDNISLPLPDQVRWADAGDVNADGLCDIIVGTVDGHLYIYYQNEGVGFSDSNKVEYVCPNGLTNADLGDLDDDGELEILVAGNSIGTMSLIELDGFTVRTISTQTGGAGGFIVCAGDANNDNRTDMLLASAGSRTISVFVQNDLFPTADFSYAPLTPVEGSPTSFDASGSYDSPSDLSTLSYQWSVQYNGSSTWTVVANGQSAETIDYAFIANGVHVVSLKVTDRGGLSAYLNHSVSVSDAEPTANFEITTSSTLEGQSVSFMDKSTSPADELKQFIWDYGDGNSETFTIRTNPTHSFEQNGTYLVKLRVIDEDGSLSEFNSTVQIDDGTPIASFTSSAKTIYENGTVWFNSTSTSPSDPIVVQRWRVDGVLVATGASLEHHFLANGTYLINLTVVDSDGSVSFNESDIQILDLGPIVDLVYTRPSGDEGVVITFNDISTSYDPIAKRYWDLGDGTHLSGVTEYHAFEQQGDYVVTLFVEDSDGTNLSKSILVTVQDTNPEVGDISTSGNGGTSFTKRTNVTFSLDVVPAYDPLTYYWVIESSAGVLFTHTTTVPSIYYRFDQGGSYEVRVLVNDTDGSLEQSLQINIMDSVPVPIFSYDIITLDGQVYFSANQTYDPDGDTPYLLYRWVFGDGSSWTDWNSSHRTMTHQYAKEGIFTVIMQVNDGNNPEAQNSTTVIIDQTPPIITFIYRPTDANIGEAIEIKVSISDATPLKSVRLIYTLDQVTWIEVPMVLTGPGNYTAQIPAQDENVEIYYSVRAVDSNNFNQTSVPVQLLVEKDMTLTYVLLVLLYVIAVLAVIIIYLWRTRPVVDEAFLIYHDGNLIAHQARRLKPGMDDQIMSSMLVAIQGFVSDSFKDEKVTGLNRMDFGDKKLMIEKREFYYLAVVLVGKRTGNVPARLEKVMDTIDEKYGIDLIAWDGDLDKIRGIKDETAPLFERVGFFDRRANNGRR